MPPGILARALATNTKATQETIATMTILDNVIVMGATVRTGPQAVNYM
jgi:hypothetical protein